MMKTVFLRKVGLYLQVHSALQPKRRTSAASPPSEPQIWCRYRALGGSILDKSIRVVAITVNWICTSEWRWVDSLVNYSRGLCECTESDSTSEGIKIHCASAWIISLGVRIYGYFHLETLHTAILFGYLFDLQHTYFSFLKFQVPLFMSTCFVINIPSSGHFKMFANK
jgi:hypothetical protein